VSRVWDVVVVSAGHAGCEAALAAARIGCDVLVLTGNLEAIGAMACNCSIEGPAKAHLVREIDALGGEMARNIDRTCTHIRTLNTTKGPAVQALRAQADKALYRQQMKRVLETTPHIALSQQMIVRIGVAKKFGAPMLLWTQQEEKVLGRRVVLTPGTFFSGLIHIGENSYSAGRAGEPASIGLSDSLRELGLALGRLKTGTVPRVSLRSINVDGLVETASDTRDPRFSLESTPRPSRPLLHCWRTSMTARTMEIVRGATDRSALGNGSIRGTRPRYCPSIETRLLQFPDRVEHGVFLERESWNTEEVYV
jgi:tRNA uridine 5-carboxymethylaminomethyl modification enzyme